MKISLQSILHNDNFMSFVRFCCVGITAAAIHYIIYYVLDMAGVWLNVAYIAGYVISFVFNYFASAYFTFRSTPTMVRFLEFASSHALNFALHIVLLNLFLYIGVHHLIAPFLVMMVAMFVQFAILRLIVFKKKK